MTRLANQHGAVNLSQGFPDFPAPEVIKADAARAVMADVNQYAITWGAKRLRDAVCDADAHLVGARDERGRHTQDGAAHTAIVPGKLGAGVPVHVS